MAFEDLTAKPRYVSFVPTKGALADIEEKLEKKGKALSDQDWVLADGKFVGYYQRSFMKMGEFNGKPKEEWTHFFTGEDKETLYGVNGMTRLDRELSKMTAKGLSGVLTEITYLGKKSSGGSTFHAFNVRIDTEKVYLDPDQAPRTEEKEDSEESEKGPTLSPSDVA